MVAKFLLAQMPRGKEKGKAMWRIQAMKPQLKVHIDGVKSLNSQLLKGHVIVGMTTRASLGLQRSALVAWIVFLVRFLLESQ